MWHGFSYLLGYRKFNSIFIRTGNNLSYSWCCCFVCWKGLWSGWTRTPSGCFWIGHHHGTEPSGGKSLQNKNLDKLEHVKENFFLHPFLKLNHLWEDLIPVFLGFYYISSLFGYTDCSGRSFWWKHIYDFYLVSILLAHKFRHNVLFSCYYVFNR